MSVHCLSQVGPFFLPYDEICPESPLNRPLIPMAMENVGDSRMALALLVLNVGRRSPDSGKGCAAFATLAQWNCADSLSRCEAHVSPRPHTPYIAHSVANRGAGPQTIPRFPVRECLISMLPFVARLTFSPAAPLLARSVAIPPYLPSTANRI